MATESSGEAGGSVVPLPHAVSAAKHPVTAVQERLNADVLLYNGPIDYDSFFDLLDFSKASKRRTNVLFVLSTGGGDADAAYRIARCLKARYEKLTVLIAGLCKSAGTLVALAADEIIMTESGELGPLDIQLRKHDEIVEFGSGLDVTTALDLLHQKSLATFRGYMLDLCLGARISAKTAADIAAQLTVGLFGKLYEQVDPVRLAEAMRATTIAMHYGQALSSNLAPEGLSKLVHSYPSHSYVIDFEEAKKIFKSVREPTDIEEEMLMAIPKESDPRMPRDNGTRIVCLNPPVEA